jgi:hypothetical protein
MTRFRIFSSKGRLVLGLLAAVLLAGAAPAAANAAAPVIPQTSFSEVTETSALLQGSVAPSKSNAEAHFEYVSDAAYKESGFATATKTNDVKVPLSVQGEGDLVGPVTATGDLTENSAVITNLKVTSGSFTKGQALSGENIPPGASVKAIGAGSLELNIPVEAGKSKAGVDLSGAASAEVSNLVFPVTGTFVPGQTISGKGIKAGTSIVAVGASSMTLSQPATETLKGAELTATATITQGTGSTEEGGVEVLHVLKSTGIFLQGQVLTGPGIKPNTTIREIQPDSEPGKFRLRLSREAIEDGAGIPLTASAPQPITSSIGGLSPQTLYHLRVTAKDAKDAEATGPEVVFFTLAPAPAYPSCPNDIFRSGELSPFGSPSAYLPDCRAYEQASPTDKDGGDVQSDLPFAKAAADGNAVAFGSTFGVPGAEGAQELPFFLAQRGADDSGWTSRGLQPPAGLGEKGYSLRGWLPDFSSTFASTVRLSEPISEALYELHSDGSAPSQVAPYAPEVANDPPYDYAGASADGAVVLFESKADLSGAGPDYPLLKGEARDLYAWDRDTGQLTLAGQMNTDAETEALLPKGTYAGPYDWIHGLLRLGGADRGFYLSDMHAISADGSAFFTSASDGQLYQRLNPTAAQSNPGPDGYIEDGRCFEVEKACTIHISATQKTNGGPDHNGSDPAGAQPAAFMAASADGNVAYFTSSEKLTNDANTGPEQPPAQIGTAALSDPDPDASKDESLISTHALGLAVDLKGEYVYWAEPQKGTIARAKLTPDGSGMEGGPDLTFIEPGETKAISFPDSEPGIYQYAPSRPRYVAVGPCAEGGECVYWTNTGPPAGEETSSQRTGGPVEGGGTVGRAKLDGGAGLLPEPEFIPGATNPQGIAVDGEHIYWGNAGRFLETLGIARATLSGQSANQNFAQLGRQPNGLALTNSSIYVGTTDGNNASLRRIEIAGGTETFIFLGQKVSVRGVAVDSGHVYWAAQGESRIGRADLDLSEGSLESLISIGGGPFGLTASGVHLYWSVNGTAPTNPGNDLYRFSSIDPLACPSAGGCLTDLTPESSGNGAEVQGVIGTSPDGTYVYFVANGSLDPSHPDAPGRCDGLLKVGRCDLYVWHLGEITYIARLALGPSVSRSDSGNLALTARELQGTAGFVEKSSYLSPDGRTLVFRSTQQLTGYENDELPEFYRYQSGQGLKCLTCNPTATQASYSPTLATARFPLLGPKADGASVVSSRHLSVDGTRFFFETAEALVAGDRNGVSGCPFGGNGRACNDVYMWEAPGAGTCKEHGPAYSELNQGCIYLISTGKSAYPSFFIDASESGDDVFFMSRDSFVGQDSDQITDIYDARVDGGLASQNAKPTPPCEIEGCLPDATAPPQVPAPPNISGPPDPKPKRCKGKKCHKSKHGHKKHRHKKHRKASR